MVKSNRCNVDHLKRAIEGTLSQPQENFLLTHLDSCPDCQYRMESMAAQQSDWKKIRQYFADDPVTDPYSGPATVDIQLRPESESATLIAGDKHQGQRRDEVQCPDWSQLNKPPHPELMGRIDGFDVEKVIGQGGMGVVYRGFDRELNRPVAIKVLADHLASNGVARKRFTREARAAAAVIHPNVVPIYGVNASADRPYIVMTLVSGRSLQTHISQTGPLSVKEVVRIAKQIASGLSAAHEQGLVHRDIKPANILLEMDVSRVMITDFGLARAADDAAITQTGWLAGTPHYMSPEQASGVDIDQRSDLFSLGSVIYFMATGREPFRAEVPVAVLKKITTDTPAPIRSLNSEMTGTLTQIVERLMAKEPDQRFESAMEVQHVLTQYLAHLEQPRLQPKPRVRKVFQFRDARNRLGQRVLWCTAVLALMLVVTGWWFWQPTGNDMSPGLERIDWQLEIRQLESEIGRLESQPASPFLPFEDPFEWEIQQLQGSIDRLENSIGQFGKGKLK